MKTHAITVRITGGKPLHGEVPIVPNKNAVLPALAASILTDETMGYHNLPSSPDVEKILKALEKMGAHVDDESGTVYICCKNISNPIVPSEFIRDMQAGYLFAGPLLARFGEAHLPIASGCRLGYRGHEDHAEYLRKLGVTFSISDNVIRFRLEESIKDDRVVISDRQSPLHPERKISYSNPFVTPTENILMLLAATSRFNTEVSGIAQEPHVAQLLSLLKSMGATIQGSGSTVSIIGNDSLKGASFTAEPDHVDYFGFAITAAITKSDLLLHIPIPLSKGIAHMNEFLEQTGVKIRLERDGVLILGSESSFSPSHTFQKADTDIYKINPGPWPMFPVDCLPSVIAWASMNNDPATATRFNNWMYSDGLKYVPPIKEMGAKIPLHDDQRVQVQGIFGGNPYAGADLIVTAPDVIEGARAVISCALAGGQYEIRNVQYILRRNPNFFNILKNLGAEIEVKHLQEPIEAMT